MSKTLGHYAFIAFLCSLILLRYATTQTPQRSKYQSFSGVAIIKGLPETDGVEKTYPLRITHQFSQIPNLYHQTNLRLKTKQDFAYGDVIQINGLLTQYNSITNARTIYLTSRPNPLIEATFSFRKHIEQLFYQSLPHDHANLALGMTLGTTASFSSPVELALQKTSTMHMVVVSGFNITIITSLVVKTAGAIHRRYALVLAILITCWFVVITGAQPPAIRAAIMAAVSLTAQLVGRTTAGLYALGVSVVLMLLITPQIIHSLSFQLSVAATLGIILFSPALSHLFTKLPLKLLHNEFATTLAAQLAVTPLILHTFGNLSVIAPVANLAVSWTIPFIMSAAALITAIGLVAPIFTDLTTFLLVPFTAFFLHATQALGSTSIGYYQNIKFDLRSMIVSYFLISILIRIIYIHKKYSDNDDLKSINKQSEKKQNNYPAA